MTRRRQIRSRKAIQQAFGNPGTPTWSIVIQHHGLSRRPATLYPQVGFRGCRFPRFLEYLHRRFVHLQDVMGQQPVPQQVDQRLDQIPRLDHPVRQRRTGEIHADPLEDGLLPVQGQGTLVFRDADVRQQAR